MAIPQLVPGVYPTVDTSQANTGNINIGQAKIIATKNGGTADDKDYLVNSLAEAKKLYGERSPLYHMIGLYFDNSNRSVKARAVAKAVSSSARVITITKTGNVSDTEAGAQILNVGDWRVPYTATSGDTALALLNKVRVAVNLVVDLPFTAPANALTGNSSLVLTGSAESTEWNDLIVEDENGLLNVASVAGTGVPIYNIATTIGEDESQVFMVSDNTDPTMTSIKTELDKRWEPTVQLYGHCISAYKGSLTDITTYLDTKTSEHISTLSLPAETRAPSALLAAALGGIVSREKQVDVARPLNTLILRGVRATTGADFTIGARDSILVAGGSTGRKTAGGDITIGRITTNHLDGLGSDNTYTDISTPFSLMYIILYIRSILSTTYGRAKLVDTTDITKISSIPGAVTLDEIRLKITSLYNTLIEQGIVQNKEFFVENVRVVKDPTEPTRVNISLPVDLVNGLHQLVVNVDVRLEA